MNYPLPEILNPVPAAAVVYLYVPEYHFEITGPVPHSGSGCVICAKPQSEFTYTDRVAMVPHDFFVVCAHCRQKQLFEDMQRRAEEEHAEGFNLEGEEYSSFFARLRESRAEKKAAKADRKRAKMEARQARAFARLNRLSE